MVSMTDEQRAFIAEASQYLEQPGLLLRLTNLVGRPVEIGMSHLPSRLKDIVADSVHKALLAAIKAASKATGDFVECGPRPLAEQQAACKRSRLGHGIVSMATGGVSGLFGGLTLAIELPVTTTVMLRSILDSARQFGFDPQDPEIQLECLSVFAMGGEARSESAMDSSYYAQRVALSRFIRDSAGFMAQKTAREIVDAATKGAAPMLVRFLVTVAERYEVTVTEKLLAQAVPIVGALGGAAVNMAFTSHFGHVATYHFGLKRLEQDCGAAKVRTEYERCAAEQAARAHPA